MEQIQVQSTVNARKLVVNRVSYVPAGGSLKLSTLVPGSLVHEATPLTAPSSGLREVCKQAEVLSGTTTTAIKVTTGEHHFKVGDFITAGAGTPSYAITSIDSASGVDTLNVGTAISLIAAGGFVYEATDEQAASSTLKNTPDAILESAFVVPTADTVMLKEIEPLLRADVLQGSIGSEYLASLKGVLEVKY